MDNKLDFEKKMKEFEKIIDMLENGNLTLDKSLEYFKIGIELSNQLAKKLDETEKQIKILTGIGDINETDIEEGEQNGI